jgi:hypothetical protein
MRKTNILLAHLCNSQFKRWGVLLLLSVIAGLDSVYAEAPDEVDREETLVWAGRSRAAFASGRPAVVERADGAIVVAGHGSHERTQGMIVIALSKSGEGQWQRLIGGPVLQHEAIGMRLLEDGSVLLLGRVLKENRSEGHAPWVGRLALDGRLMRERRIDGKGIRTAWAFDACAEGFAVMAGQGDGPYVWVIKTDPQDRVIWGRTLTRSGVRLEAYDARCTSDDGVVLTGHLNRDVWMAKLDRDGDLEWSLRAGDSDRRDIGWGAVQTNDGGFIIAGETEAMGADGMLWVLRIDAKGRPKWQSGLGGPRFDVPRNVVPDFAGGMWILGRNGTRSRDDNTSPLWTVHVTEEGTVLAESVITEPAVLESVTRGQFGIAATRDGGAAVAIRSFDHRGGRWRLRMLKVDSTGRTVRGYPWLEALQSPLRRGNLTVRPAPLELGRLEAQATEVRSVELEIPLEFPASWETDVPSGPPHPRRPPASRPLPPLVAEVEDSPKEISAAQLLIDGRFKALELRAAELIRTQEKNENGRWVLPVFYEELAVDSEPLLGFGLERSLGFLQYWHQKRPGSITARVALAAAYLDVAWEHRGVGLGREVTKEGGDAARKHIQAASELLAPLYADRPEDPMYWVVLLTIAHVGGESPVSTDEVLATGLEIAPDFIQLFVTEVVFLLPQWGGGRGAVEGFAAEMSDRRAQTLGDELYARAAMQLFYSEPDATVFGEHTMKWPRVRSGLRLILDRYPSRWNLHMAARLACLAGDREEASRLLMMDGAEYGDDVARIWYKAENFDQQRAWALRRPAGDWARLPVSEWPPLAMAIEPGVDPRPDDDARVGFLVRRPDGAPLVITAVDFPVYEQGHPAATLDRLALPDRVAAWSVLLADRDAGTFSGMRAVGLRTPPGTSVDPSLVLAQLPDSTVDPGVPALPVVAGEDLNGVWVVSCAEGRPGCVQQLVRGRVSGEGRDTDSTTPSIALDVDELGFENTRLGAPVVDALGRAVGVVVEKQRSARSDPASPAFRLRCLVLEELLPLTDPENHYLVPSRSPAGQSAVSQAVLRLVADSRWEDLRWLADTARDLRADDGSWVGLGLLDAFTKRVVEPVREPGRRPFDTVGAALGEWQKREPTDSLAVIAAMSHAVATYPDMPEGVVWTREEWMVARQKWCEHLQDPVAAMIEDLPNDVYARVVGVRHASDCRGLAEVTEALEGLATIAPDLTPVFVSALVQLDRRLNWTPEELNAAIDRVAATGGPEVQSTLYGLVLKGRLRHDREVEPEVDLERTVANLESWIELYPGGVFDEANLLNVLCIKGDTAAAAARLDIVNCSDVSIGGSIWSKEICRTCFGGNFIPRSAEAIEHANDSR